MSDDSYVYRVEIRDTLGGYHVEEAEDVSFVDNNTHGPVKSFGVTESFLSDGNEKLLICTPNVVSVRFSDASLVEEG